MYLTCSIWYTFHLAVTNLKKILTTCIFESLNSEMGRACQGKSVHVKLLKQEHTSEFAKTSKQEDEDKNHQCKVGYKIKPLPSKVYSMYYNNILLIHLSAKNSITCKSLPYCIYCTSERRKLLRNRRTFTRAA